MTKADWLILAGYLLLISAAGMFSRPLGLLTAGAVCILLGRAATERQRKRRRSAARNHPLASVALGEDLE